MMRILYDGYIFSSQRGGGISRYFASIIKRLPEEWNPVIRCREIPTAVRPEHANIRFQPFPVASFKPQVVANRACRAYFDARDLYTDYDLAHPTYHFRIPKEKIRRRGKPLVFTVHDMIHEIYSEDLDPHGIQASAKAAAIRCADAILCVSQNTKADLQARFNIPDSRITVTHLASDLNRAMSFGDEAVPEQPYCLFMGNRASYKNFARVLVALQRLLDNWPELRLCVVGEPFNMHEKEFIAALRLGHKVELMNFVSDSHLAKLYRCSHALIYPSMYEGFGIPPLEAMACGTIVICSDRASLPEVVGNAAVIVNPESVSSIADAILSLKDLGAHRETLINRGFQQAVMFDWNETAHSTARVYSSLLA